MVKGNASTTKVHYKGKEDDFLVFIDDVETFKKWQKDKSIPMAHFISTYKVFITHRERGGAGRVYLHQPSPFASLGAQIKGKSRQYAPSASATAWPWELVVMWQAVSVATMQPPVDAEGCYEAANRLYPRDLANELQNPGQYDGASHATLDNEFGTHTDDEVIKKILETGNLQEAEFPERSNSKNDAQQGSIVNGQPGVR
ncbi:hypothetical protein DL770_001134 [Monosporascus sp. CRB-9-2]|nr:hypothetical protein DL770_001134 [Monosporascus sp. CRB-9-2]